VTGYGLRGEGYPPPGTPPPYRMDDHPQYTVGGPPQAPPPARGQSSLVRPYVVTGGRTAPRTHLAVEALVSSVAWPHHDMSGWIPECQAISSLCRRVCSVAEVSALLRIPLGVTRILVADMAAEGLVQVYQPTLEAGKPDLNLLERVLSGLRRL
jgi:hypothetical protein